MALIAVGQPLEVRDDDPDYPALLLINHILGGSASSRLFNRLRQKEGLSYGAFSQITAGPQDRLGAVLRRRDLRAPERRQGDGRDARGDRQAGARRRQRRGTGHRQAQLRGGLGRRIAEDDFVADELTQGLYLDRTFQYWARVNERIQSLTAADLLSVARKYLKPEKLARVRAGDLAKKSSS